MVGKKCVTCEYNLSPLVIELRIFATKIRRILSVAELTENKPGCHTLKRLIEFLQIKIIYKLQNIITRIVYFYNWLYFHARSVGVFVRVFKHIERNSYSP